MYVLVLISINLYTKFEVPNFTHSKDTIWAQILNGSRDPDHHFPEWFVLALYDLLRST